MYIPHFGDVTAALKDHITERQREISRIVTPLIQQYMLPAYQKACDTGTIVYMKDHVTDHTAAKKKVIFHPASQSLKNWLMKLQVTFFNVDFFVERSSFQLDSWFELININTFPVFTLPVLKSVSVKASTCNSLTIQAIVDGCWCWSKWTLKKSHLHSCV